MNISSSMQLEGAWMDILGTRSITEALKLPARSSTRGQCVQRRSSLSASMSWRRVQNCMRFFTSRCSCSGSKRLGDRANLKKLWNPSPKSTYGLCCLCLGSLEVWSWPYACWTNWVLPWMVTKVLFRSYNASSLVSRIPISSFSLRFQKIRGGVFYFCTSL